ncbi:hypothetical protein BDR04DRAFT_1110782 [Suillus decipiens]|nr:hypothetical protein BDR04DRAFT_1110782 [Suillus decipiens]
MPPSSLLLLLGARGLANYAVVRFLLWKPKLCGTSTPRSLAPLRQIPIALATSPPSLLFLACSSVPYTLHSA